MNQNGKKVQTTNRRPVPRPRVAANEKKIPQTQARPRTVHQTRNTPRTVQTSQKNYSAQAKVSGQSPSRNVRRTASSAPQARPQRPIDHAIKDQTPSRRQAQRSGKRLTGSVKNMEVRHSTKTTKTKFRVKKEKPALRLILARLVIFLISFAAIFGVVSGLFVLNLTHITGISGSDYDIQIGMDDSDSVIKYKSPADIIGANGTYNISIDQLRQLCEFTVTGDSETLRYIPRGSENQSAAFVTGTDIAYVNGVMIHMESPCFMLSGELYVPISFLKNYAANIQIIHNPSESKITVMRTETSESAADTKKDADKAVYEPIIFLLSENQPLANITEESVDKS